jgi:hypothetical protein
MQLYAAQNATNVAGCYLQNQKIKKKSTCAGQAPPSITIRRRPLTQAEKTPEPLPHPYTRAR